MLFAEDDVEVLKELFYKLYWTECWQSSRLVWLYIYKVCYFLFNGVVDLFVDGELRFEPSSLSAYRLYNNNSNNNKDDFIECFISFGTRSTSQ